MARETNRWWRTARYPCPTTLETESRNQNADDVEDRGAASSSRGTAWMRVRRATPWVCIVFVLFLGGLSAVAGPLPGMPPGVQPLPIDPAHPCDPVGNEDRFRSTDAKGRTVIDYGWHGAACLDEGRYKDAIPYLERGPNTTVDAFVWLGVAYDGAGRPRDAVRVWNRARQLYRSSLGQDLHLDFDRPVGLEPALFGRHYATALAMLEKYFAGYDVPGAWSCCPPGHLQATPYNPITFQDLGLVDPLTNALHVAAQGNPQHGAELISILYKEGNGQAAGFGELRYPRAIMLLAVGRWDEARIELRLAARMSTPPAHYESPYPFQWSALAILQRLAR